LKTGVQTVLILSWQEGNGTLISVGNNTSSGASGSSGSSSLPGSTSTPVSTNTGNAFNSSVTSPINSKSNQDSDNTRLPVIQPILQKESLRVYFSGEFTTDVSADPDIRIRFDTNTLTIINACNSHSADYKAY